jgi:hypothetical protein
LDSKFNQNVPQTWNPHTRPTNIIKECFFQRVVHTSDTPNILADIKNIQGRNGIYYAGAYAVDGMGLLEQAGLE